MLRQVWFLAVFILLFASATAAQTARPETRTPTSRTADRYPDDGQEATHLPDEMRVKMEIARREEDHKKVLEDVERLTSLSGEIAKDYGERKRLSPDDIRKLGAIEKLAKRVLTQSGGEEFDRKSDDIEHMQLGDAIDLLRATAASIRKEVTAETRFGVSATVIANSNEVIELSRFIRRAKKAD